MLGNARALSFLLFVYFECNSHIDRSSLMVGLGLTSYTCCETTLNCDETSMKQVHWRFKPKDRNTYKDFLRLLEAAAINLSQISPLVENSFIHASFIISVLAVCVLYSLMQFEKEVIFLFCPLFIKSCSLLQSHSETMDDQTGQRLLLQNSSLWLQFKYHPQLFSWFIWITRGGNTQVYIIFFSHFYQ